MNLSEAEWLIALWLAALGGLIGSFVNVVVYRLPAGMSIVRPRSHCPACRHPIRWFDNVPVFSWFLLGRRCRDCRAAISPRYPLIEAAVAGLFLLLAFGELFPGGGNLPPPRGPLTEAHVWGIYAYHLMLLCTLLAAAVIQYDGHRPPGRLFLPAAVVGLAAPAFWPMLHPMPAWQAATGPLHGILGGILDGVVGLAAGTAAGALLVRLTDSFCRSASLAKPQANSEASGENLLEDVLRRLAGGRRGDAGLYFGAACAGLFLGWQAVCGLVAATAAVSWLVWAATHGRPAARRLPPVAWLALGALGWILAWGLLVRWVSLV
jgi:leader peptidase (prepilin peptidase)/N-methyltransferase